MQCVSYDFPKEGIPPPIPTTYHNFSLGLATNVRACRGPAQEWSLGVTFHAPKSVGECEGMNSHTPKWAPILGVKVPMESCIFKE